MDYHITVDGLVKFRDKICVPNNMKLKNLILREFYIKSHLGHPRYQKTLTVVKKFHHWPNLKKEVGEYVARCLESQ